MGSVGLMWTVVREVCCPYGTDLVLLRYQALRTWLPSYSPFGTKTLNTCPRIRREITTDRAPPFRGRGRRRGRTTANRKPPTANGKLLTANPSTRNRARNEVQRYLLRSSI